MYSGQFFDDFPLWGLFLGTVALLLIPIEIGFHIAKYRRRRAKETEQESVGSIVAATLGLLAFMLAFTFGMAGSRFDMRKQLVLNDANAIGTTYLRAGLLPEPERTEIRKLLREYVNIRVPKGGLTPEVIDQLLIDSDELQKQLWSRALAIGEKNPESVVAGLFIQSLNEMIDNHSKRVTVGIESRIPVSIWAALYFVAILAMVAMGYQSGMSGTRNAIGILALVLTFSAVLVLISDLDRPLQQLTKVSQNAMLDLQSKLVTPPD